MYDKALLHITAYNLVSIICNCIDIGFIIKQGSIEIRNIGKKLSFRFGILLSHITHNKVESKLKHISCFHSRHLPIDILWYISISDSVYL